jgi:hypothetical protein
MSKGKVINLFIVTLPWETFESLRNSPMYPMMDFGNIVAEE